MNKIIFNEEIRINEFLKLFSCFIHGVIGGLSPEVIHEIWMTIKRRGDRSFVVPLFLNENPPRAGVKNK